jgi:ABC-type multidrug transport system ATPase subunit
MLVIVVSWKILPGADEAMMFDLVTSLCIMCQICQTSIVASILQPSSEVFQLFDRIIVLDKGQIMFQGPRQDALPYFESLWYMRKKREEENGPCVHTYIHT